MASTYSTSLRLELMATGDQSGTWGDTTNTNLGTLLEQAITGVLSVAQGDTTLTLTSTDGASDQARNAVVNLTGAMTGAQNVVVPDANKLYLIKNSTSGGFAVTVKTSAGTGVTVPAGTARWVYADGTNVVDGMSGPWSPSSNDAQALGISGTAWSDLFLASGGVINWVAGDVTITHSTNALAFAGATSGYSFDELVSTSGSGAGFVGFRATSTNSGAAAGPVLDLYRDSNSPAANDVLGQILFNGEDSAGNTQEYGSIEAVITDPTSTSEDSTLDFYVQSAGSRVLALSLSGASKPLTNVVLRVFTANDTYTPTTGMKYCIIECCGGGGGGGGVDGTVGHGIGAGGGGGGGYAQKRATAADIGASKSVTIGAAGSAGSSTPGNGGDGGDTSVGTLCIGKGGTGGANANSSTPGAGGAGGVAGTGDLTFPGGDGDNGGGSLRTDVYFQSGGGGDSFFGAGAQAVRVVANGAYAGTAGHNYGGGGSGAAEWNQSNNAAGGAGAPGVVVITEFI